MMRAAAATAALGFLMAFSGWALAQTGVLPMTVTLEYGKSITVAVAGATAAYALDGTVADVAAENGSVRIHAVGAGKTTVVVVTGATTVSIVVEVPVPKLAVQLGTATGGAGGGTNSEGGTYSGTYASNPGEVSNAFDFWSRQGGAFERMLVVSATYVSPNSGSTFGFPLLSYEMASPGHDVTFLDQAVTTSPLTFQDALVRGLHVRDGLWSFHGGVSSIAQFSNFFVPTNPQWMAGVTRQFAISANSTLSANLYDIINTPGTLASTEGGVIGSLLYAWHPRPRLDIYGELGLSRAIGFAAGITYDDAKQHLAASLLEKPSDFASLAVDAQQGSFATADYDRSFSDRVNGSADFQRSDYNLPVFHEDSLTQQSNVNYAFGKNLTLNGGELYSNFVSYVPTSFSSRTLSAPLGLTYASSHLSLGVQWQPTTDFSGTFANGYGASAGVTYGGLQVGGYFNHNVDIPIVSTIFSEVPGFQAALEAAGINVTDPAELAQLLGNAALLARLGFSGLQLNLAPVQNNTGFNANWTIRGRQMQQVSFSYLNSDAALSLGSFGFRIASLQYTRHVGLANDLTASVGYLKSVEDTGASTSVSSAPTFSLTISHRFSSAPGFLFPSKHGDIGGYVFRDDGLTGEYAASNAGLAGVPVSLDGQRTAYTDAQGHYEFAGVSYGAHQVAAQIQSASPYYFTTDSPATAQAGSTVDFGVTFVAGKLFGSVVNDAGAGIEGVVVRASGLKQTVTTQDDGRFTMEGVPNGQYTVTASPDSLPGGYDLTTLVPGTAKVSSSVPAPVTLTVRALRSLSGTVMLFDPRRSSVVPATGMVVTIPELGVSVETDQNGAYAFRGLPAGTLTVEVQGGGPGERRGVILPTDPTVMTGVDFRVTLAQERERERQSERTRQ